jgi:hypothetical protein
MSVVTQRTAVALSLAGASILALGFGLLRGSEPAPARATGAASKGSVALRCSFEPGETAAFTLESTVRDVRGEPGERDHFRGTLSWEVAEQLSPTRWRLRSALSDISRSQALTLPEERATGPLTDPFFIDVDASCRFVGFGFARDWDARRRQLVQAMLTTHEFVLPPTARTQDWIASQSDGLGPFEASYTTSSRASGSAVRIERRKAAYDGQAGAAAMGLSIVVVGSEASASFDRDQPGWLKKSSGLERIQIRVQGEVEADLLQQFKLARDDSQYVAVHAMDPHDADFRDAFDLELEDDRLIDAQMAQVSYDEALETFLAHFGGADDRSYAAARQLAAWLRAHPDQAHGLIDALRAGAIADAARPALFLGLELSGTEAARDALAVALEDPQLRAVDRARAASALSDIGEPTRGTAELLLAQAQADDMVASVSVLGLGSMARRGDDDLKTYVRASLEQELIAAVDESKTRVILDAMGNTGDPAFADDLEAHLGADNAATRQHAAQALGRLDPGEAGPRLLSRLGRETDPSVSAAIVGAYRGPPTADAIALMSDKLAASTSTAERAALIGWLGSASRTEPDAQSRLVAHLHQETDSRLMQQIGTFVPAAELR